MDIQRPIRHGINRVMVKLSTPEESAVVNSPNESNTSNETVGNTSNEAFGNTSNGVNLNATTTNETVTMETTINSSAELSQIRPNLPKLALSREWTGFWDSYETAVHDNPLLSPIDKFNYLNTLLQGPAARAIHGLALTSANYNHAIAVLKERFGKPQRVITSQCKFEQQGKFEI